jgi:hypothetical protein
MDFVVLVVVGVALVTLTMTAKWLGWRGGSGSNRE